MDIKSQKNSRTNGNDNLAIEFNLWGRCYDIDSYDYIGDDDDVWYVYSKHWPERAQLGLVGRSDKHDRALLGRLSPRLGQVCVRPPVGVQDKRHWRKQHLSLQLWRRARQYRCLWRRLPHGERPTASHPAALRRHGSDWWRQVGKTRARATAMHGRQ